MQIVTLLENETEQKNLKAIHGLSLYIETFRHKILFDVGPNNYFIKNAKQLGVDLSDIDIVVISHGHYDHGMGLSKFLKVNSKAKIYIAKDAFVEHVKQSGNKFENIGIKSIKNQSRFVFVEDDVVIDDELTVYANVPFADQPIKDSDLKMYHNGHYLKDDFHHEIYLVIKEEEHCCLFSGCSHNGIQNIITTLEKRSPMAFTHIFGGYHFSHYDTFDFKQTDYLTHLGQTFAKTDSRYYSCHCTGNEAFYQLKIQMQDKLHRLKTGDVVII